MIGKTALAGALVVTASVVLAGQGSGSASPTSTPTPTPTPETKALGVEEFMTAVDQHRGVVRVEGIVSAVTTETKALALIDLKEFQHCGVVTCAPFTLPVQWAGRFPSVRDHVLVEGKVAETGGKLVFVAREIKTVSQAPGGTK